MRTAREIKQGEKIERPCFMVGAMPPDSSDPRAFAWWKAWPEESDSQYGQMMEGTASTKWAREQATLFLASFDPRNPPSTLPT